jgi:hypothetical protein
VKLVIRIKQFLRGTSSLKIKKIKKYNQTKEKDTKQGPIILAFRLEQPSKDLGLFKKKMLKFYLW